jgi:hypothetical protein|mmetsp:Transcript_27333/g.43895  ORF Transcript_27333/g.43895 Transcript_27333/m.43895 type:complete len:140 (-) Transcript_27333:1412-1831(-)
MPRNHTQGFDSKFVVFFLRYNAYFSCPHAVQCGVLLMAHTNNHLNTHTVYVHQCVDEVECSLCLCCFLFAIVLCNMSVLIRSGGRNTNKATLWHRWHINNRADFEMDLRRTRTTYCGYLGKLLQGGHVQSKGLCCRSSP